MSIELTSQNFTEEVLQSDELTVVDFWAEWCGPCKVMSPIVDELAGELQGVRVGKLNVDEHQDIAQQHNILSIPTFILFKGGQVVDQFAGSMPKEALREKIEKHL